MGLTLNTSDGQITLSSSTAGNYEITRTVTNSNGSLSSTATDIVVINPADNAAFSYSGSPYDIADASNPTPTVTGLSGGTFSSISGFNFDGTDDITLPSITLSNDFSFSFWFYTTSATATMYFFGEGANWCRISNGVFDVKFNGSQLTDNPSPAAEPTFTIPTNQWNNVILVKDSNSLIQVYFNGQVDPNYTPKGVTQPGGSGNQNQPFTPGFIGRRSPNYFTGKLSSFALWNSDQSSNMSNIYNNGVPQGSYTSTPYVWYKMSNDATYNSSTSTWSIPNAANPGTLDASSTTLSSNSLDYLDTNSSTGLISLSTSNIGTYSVSYNTTSATESICPATSTQSVQLVNTNFDYPTNVCNAAGSPNVTPTNFIQQTGGQFTISPTSGLTINATSGVLSPASSTAGTYAITYTIGSNSTTKNVTSGAVLAPSTTTNTSTLSFNGTNSYVQAASTSDFAFGTSGYSISLWFKPNGTNSGLSNAGVNILDMRSTSTSEPVPSLWVRTDGTNGFIKLLVELNYKAQATVTLNSGSWYHLIVTNDGSNSKIYLNGNTTPIASGIDTTNYVAGPLLIGKFYANNSYSFNGEIDEVAIWNTNLTSCDVAGIYQASSNGITADLSTVYPSNLKYYNRMGE